MEKRRVITKLLSYGSLLLLLIPAMALAKMPLMLYTSVPLDVIKPIIKEFRKRNPDIHVEGFRSGTNQIILRVKSDLQSTGKVQADLIWVADPAYYMDLKGQGLLLKYASPRATGIPATFKDPDGFFTAGRILNMGITYNTNLVRAKEAPRDWEDLLDSKWKGQIGMPDPNRSGSALDAVEALSSKYGWGFFRSLRKNEMIVTKGNSRLLKKVTSGKLKVAIALDFITRQFKLRRSPLEFAYPISGAVSIASPLAIIKTTKYPAEAMRFIDFILSNEGQEVVVKIGKLYSVNELYAPPMGAPPFSTIAKKALPINWKKIKEDRDKIIKRFTNIVQN